MAMGRAAPAMAGGGLLAAGARDPARQATTLNRRLIGLVAGGAALAVAVAAGLSLQGGGQGGGPQEMPRAASDVRLPKPLAERIPVYEWLMWQMGGFGPMLGQAHHFLRAAPTRIEYGMKRYVDEAKRLYGVLDKQLAGNAFVAGEEYTIADMSIFPWAARHEWHTVNLADFPNVKRWYDIVNARPAVTKGMAVPYLN